LYEHERQTRSSGPDHWRFRVRVGCETSNMTTHTCDWSDWYAKKKDAKLQAACFALLRKEASADKLFHTAWSSSPAVVFQHRGASPSVGSRVAIGTAYWGAGAGASSVLDPVLPTLFPALCATRFAWVS